MPFANPKQNKDTKQHYDVMLLEAQQKRLVKLTKTLCMTVVPKLAANFDYPGAEQAQVELAHLCMEYFEVFNVLTGMVNDAETHTPLFEPVEEGSIQWLVLIVKHMRTTVWQAYESLDEDVEQRVAWRTWSGLTRFQGCLLQAAIFLDEELTGLTGSVSPLAEIRSELALEAQEAKRTYRWFEHQVSRVTRHPVDEMSDEDARRCLIGLNRTMDVLQKQSCFEWMYAQDRVRFMFLRRRLTRAMGDEVALDDILTIIREISRFAERLLNVERREIFSESVEDSFVSL